MLCARNEVHLYTCMHMFMYTYSVFVHVYTVTCTYVSYAFRCGLYVHVLYLWISDVCVNVYRSAVCECVQECCVCECVQECCGCVHMNVVRHLVLYPLHDPQGI